MFNVNEDGSIGMNFSQMPAAFLDAMSFLEERDADLARQFPEGIEIEFTDGTSMVVDTTP